MRSQAGLTLVLQPSASFTTLLQQEAAEGIILSPCKSNDGVFILMQPKILQHPEGCTQSVALATASLLA